MKQIQRKELLKVITIWYPYLTIKDCQKIVLAIALNLKTN